MSQKFQSAVQHRGDVSYVKLGGVIDEDNELTNLVDKIPLGLMIQVDTMCHKIPNFVAKSKRAGVTRVFIGLENINPDNLTAAKKRQNKRIEVDASGKRAAGVRPQSAVGNHLAGLVAVRAVADNRRVTIRTRHGVSSF